MCDESDLDVLLCNEPGSVRQQFVECLKTSEFGGSVLKATQPALLPAGLQETSTMLLHQVRTMVSSCRLRKSHKYNLCVATKHA